MKPVTPAPADARLDELNEWLARCLGGRPYRLAPASADASFRRYFRVWDGEATFVAMDAPPPNEDVRPFVAIARALEAAGLNVPHIHDEDAARGFLLLSDLGSTHYLSALNSGADPDRLYAPAARALLTMQTNPALTEGLASYDRAELGREVALFPEWFLGRHLGLLPDARARRVVEAAFEVLCEAATEQPQVFVHKDFHSRNLMVCPPSTPGIIDFQDALRGPVTYDLVSLYKDCYVRWPRERVVVWVEEYRALALARGLRLPGRAAFLRWFDLVGAQRHLKVLGIFARLWYRDCKASYLADLPRVFDYVTEVAGTYAELGELYGYLSEVVAPRFESAQRRASR